MKRERLEPPRKTRGGFRYLSPQQRLERRLARGTAANRVPADPTVARLMRTIAECKERERQSWAKLATYLATGRTVVRERLYEDADLPTRRPNVSLRHKLRKVNRQSRPEGVSDNESTEGRPQSDADQAP